MVKNGLARGAMSYAFMECLGAFLVYFHFRRRENRICDRCESEAVLSAVAEGRSGNPAEVLQSETPALEFTQDGKTSNLSLFYRFFTVILLDRIPTGRFSFDHDLS